MDYYRQHPQTFTGFGWKFFHLGPWAAEDPALSGLVAHGVLSEQRSNSSEYDTGFCTPKQRVDTRCLFGNVKDESILIEVLSRWGTRSTGEILNYVYFQTEPMEAGIRNQPLDFSLIPTERPAVYSHSSSGKSPAGIRKFRAQFERQQAEKKSSCSDTTMKRTSVLARSSGRKPVIHTRTSILLTGTGPNEYTELREILMNE